MFIIVLAGLASFRRRPVNSNVSPPAASRTPNVNRCAITGSLSQWCQYGATSTALPGNTSSSGSRPTRRARNWSGTMPQPMSCSSAVLYATTAGAKW